MGRSSLRIHRQDAITFLPLNGFSFHSSSVIPPMRPTSILLGGLLKHPSLSSRLSPRCSCRVDPPNSEPLDGLLHLILDSRSFLSSFALASGLHLNLIGWSSLGCCRLSTRTEVSRCMSPFSVYLYVTNPVFVFQRCIFSHRSA